MTQTTAFCELVSQQDGKKYRAQLDVVLTDVNADEETAAIDANVKSWQMTPGQRIPDGNYTRLPFQYDSEEKRVRVVSGKMILGWL